MAHEDFTLTAGKAKPAGCYPELVRVEKSGAAVFRFHQETTYEETVPVGHYIPEGDSDFCGVLMRSDAARQTAVVRQFDLGRPLGAANQ